jgi:DNA-binding NtrC family response regulator
VTVRLIAVSPNIILRIEDSGSRCDPIFSSLIKLNGLNLYSWQKIETWIKENPMDQSLKLLIIDDDEHLLANLCYFLTDKKYDVISVTNGLEGLKLLEDDQEGFNLIITDIVMPQISGISLISIIKKKMPDIPVIAITAWGEYPEEFAIESQADKVLSKPFELSELDKAINELISSQKHTVRA